VKYRKFRKLKKNQEEVIDRADNHVLIESVESLFVDFKMFDETTRETLSRMEYSVNTSPLVALLKKKADTTKLIDLQDNMGRTALHIAALCNKPQIIRVLLDHDASLIVEDFEGKRPVDLSLSNQITSLMIIRMKEVAKRDKGHVQLTVNKE
jgi:ankyrin repeat protein